MVIIEIQSLKGVGSKTAKALQTLGITTVKDAIFYYPRAYEDRSNIKPLNEAEEKEFISTIVEVSIIYPAKQSFNHKKINRILFKNSTGFITGVWFNQPYIVNNFKVGERIFLYGKVTYKSGQRQIIDPKYEKDLSSLSNRIVPIYATNKYVSQKILSKIIFQALQHIDKDVVDCIPKIIQKRYDLFELNKALKFIHYPTDSKIIDKCKKRLKFEELLTLQLGLYLTKQNGLKDISGFKIPVSPKMKDFKETIPFELTMAQKKVVREVLTDMKNDRPMNRLIQGDVGSGKTIIAIIALFNCAMNGFQGAMMAPTEILAQQHYNTISKMLESYGINVCLLTGSTPKKNKSEYIQGIANGYYQVIIGTHALIQDNIEFKNLALVITDEQHRFGVKQRAALVCKGHNPHVLVMTATPIPRTLALFLYADMDVSAIDELPPNRKKVTTTFVNSTKRDKVYDFVKHEIDSGRQVYIVCPLIEDSDVLNANSTFEIEKILRQSCLKGYNICVLHGKMTPSEKDAIMEDFKDTRIDILISTTVIEVGINVPNASIMIIENSDRFGLAQLHQLRGRVGRGDSKSYCILISDVNNDEVKRRMKILTDTEDGFKIAEKDLEIRGTGEFFGIRQHGLTELKIADPLKDFDILKLSRNLSKQLIDSGEIWEDEYSALREKINNLFDINFSTKTFN